VFIAGADRADIGLVFVEDGGEKVGVEQAFGAFGWGGPAAVHVAAQLLEGLLLADVLCARGLQERRFAFEDNDWDAVDEDDDIGDDRLIGALDLELARDQEIVSLHVVEVDEAHGLESLMAFACFLE